MTTFKPSKATPTLGGRLSLGAIALAMTVLSGCSLAPIYDRPVAPVAERWPAQLDQREPSKTSSAADMPWQEFVQDDRLRQLIDLALQNNRDLRVAVKNIDMARAQYQINRSAIAPTLNANMNGLRAKPNSDGFPVVGTSYTVGLGISAWELDLFGRLRSLSDSALAKYLSLEESRKAAQISLVGAVANTWLNLQANTELLGLAQRTLQTRQQSLALVKRRMDTGVASAMDGQQAQSLAATAAAAVSQQQRLRAQDMNALTLLLGQPVPEQLLPRATEDGSGKNVPRTLPTDPLSKFAAVDIGLPSEVLLRRPDIQAAEQQLIAANANIGAARAAFFPRISLTGTYGRLSSEFDNLFNGEFVRSWSFAPQITLPIFEWGRNMAGLDASHAGRDIALAQYEKAIQVAFREVADALAGRATLSDQLAAQQLQADAERQRYHLADLRYRNGIDSHLTVLDAQRSLFASEQALIQTRLMERTNQVNLYKALGGGWKQVD